MKKFLPFHEVTPKVAVILLVWLGTAFVPTYAQPVLWTLDNVAFEDGSTATGSFEYDPSVGTFGTYSNINVTVTLPGGSTILYDATRPNANLNTQAAFVPEGGVNTGQRHLTLRFLTPLTAGGGTVPLILANTFLGTCFNGACTAFGSPAWFATMATPVTGEPLAAPAPTVTCRPATVMLDASGDASLDPNLVVLAASGAPPLNFSISPSTFDCGDVPSTMTTVTLTDGNGATASCTATVTVEDNTAPLFCGDSDASASVYDDGWQDGDNDGDGFGPWDLRVSTSDLTQAGHFIGNSTFNGDGDDNGDGDINTGDRAWGLYANNGAQTSANRDLSQELTVGSSLRIKIDNGFVDDLPSNLGLQTWSNGGTTNSWYLRLDGGDAEYQTLSGDGLEFIGIPFTDEGLEVELTTLSLTQIRVTVRSLDSDNPAVFSEVATLLNSGFIDQIRIFNNNVGMDGPRDLFINDLSVCYADDDICPDVTVDANANCEAVVNYAVTLFDNCAGEVPVQFSPASGSTFGLGTTTVNGTASDGNGNTTTCSFTVTVNDVTPPVLECQDITVNLPSTSGDTIVSMPDLRALAVTLVSDNCGNPSGPFIDGGEPERTFSCSQVGAEVMITLVTSDGTNSTRCTVGVTVVDPTTPVLECEETVTVGLDEFGELAAGDKHGLGR
jgi:hypothetical protein